MLMLTLGKFMSNSAQIVFIHQVLKVHYELEETKAAQQAFKQLGEDLARILALTLTVDLVMYLSASDMEVRW